jgi:CheY-like chemotaxis protein
MLALATLDPFDRPTFDALAEMTGMQIYLALATRDDIVAAIKKHYVVGRWATSGSKKVLIVDPSPVVTQLLHPHLEKEGYEVLVAHDGIEGLKLTFSHHPDVVLCDLATPRLDGYTFMHAINTHSETTGIPVILLSTKVSPEEEIQALEAGFAAFVGKPVVPIRVVVAIKRTLAQGSDEKSAPLAGEHQRPSPRGRRWPLKSSG